jgi:hypothetical protein
MKALKTFCIVMLILLGSCRNDFGDKNLGDGFYITEYEGRYTPLEYYPYGIEKHSLYGIIEESVIKFGYNDKYIIAKTSVYDIADSSFNNNYWLVDKTIPNGINFDKSIDEIDSLLKLGISGPLDSLKFYELINDRNIRITFN